jgi:hypothetical protein
MFEPLLFEGNEMNNKMICLGFSTMSTICIMFGIMYHSWMYFVVALLFGFFAGAYFHGRHMGE